MGYIEEPERATIGTQEAAQFLEVSRPYIIRLLDKGEIPFSRVKTRRRIKISDLVAYQTKMRRTRKKQLKFLTRQAQELNLGYSDK
jgi:excisionase family DNA binding protein